MENCHGCDVLIHEAYTQEGFPTLSPEFQKYFLSFHTSTKELAEIATRANPGLLIIYHQMLSNDEVILSELRRSYGGKVVSAKDLDIY